MILHAIAAKLKQRSKADFTDRHYEATLIVQAVSWYLRYPPTYRDIEELFLEPSLEVDHSTVNRWVLAYAPLIEKRLRAFRKPHCGSVCIDETYSKVRGQWGYLYRAVDKHDTSGDFPADRQTPSRRRQAVLPQNALGRMLSAKPLLAPDRIGTDGAGPYPPAVAEGRKEGLLLRDGPLLTKHQKQGIESDHFRIKKNMRRVGGFRSFNRARAPSRTSRPYSGCAGASALPAYGLSVSRTSCSGSAFELPQANKA